MNKKRFLLVLIIILFDSINLFAQFSGKANPASVVISGNARFTMLTPHIVRMEWSRNGQFEDHASLTFINRNLPVPKFEKTEQDGNIKIKTEALLLNFKSNSGKFDADNLQIEFEVNAVKKLWKPGTENKGNLLGTTRTLDGVNGASDFEQGLLSREGWTLIDDSEKPLFDNSDWPWVMPRPEDNEIQDWYYFAYGNDYKIILKEFTEVAGKIAMPPKFAFGYWWSRYWKYTDQEFKDLVNEFKIHDMPLDVLVIDMDWHLVNSPEWFEDGKKKRDQADQWQGWTGFTWNKSVFPDYKNFLEYTNKLNIKTCLNLHPASGIQPHEEVYPVFAKAMGIDPSINKYVPFDITNKNYAQNYLDLVLHPMEKAGIDFWWLDWQQWSTTKIKGVNPTFYLNYVHFSDMERQNLNRPLLYHRWGGLGNHRYQIGFSGDTHITWESLAFQPFFTATASNVCYGYWSHDIGGHMSGEEKKNAELYTRWIQWGAFSPILRTHCTKDPEIERRVWAYPLENYYAMRSAIKLRYALIPYIYTAAREAYDTGISILRPMYYDYPKEDVAYEMKGQYMFGNDMLVSPITHSLGDKIFTEQKVWLPEGKWIEWNSGLLLNGGKEITHSFCLEEIPVYIKEGAIIPMQKDINNTADEKKDYMILNVFPGDKGSAKIYDDEGNNQNFKEGKYTFTKVEFEKKNYSVTLNILPVEGSFDGMPHERAYELRFPVSFPPVEVKVNGENYNYDADGNPKSWNYNGNDLTTFIFTPKFSTSQKVIVEINFPEEDINLLSGKKKIINSLLKLAKGITNVGWGEKGWDESKANSDSVIWLAQTGNRITMDPTIAVRELKSFDAKLATQIKIIESQAGESEKITKPFELLKTSLILK